MLRVELRKARLRVRTYVMLGILIAISTVIVIGIHGSRQGPNRPADPVEFQAGVLRNGSALPFACLIFTSTFLLPLLISVYSGEALAGEASAGTLRYVLVRPVRRERLYGAKLGSIAVFALTACALVAAVGAGLGYAVFGSAAWKPVAVRGFQGGSRFAPGLEPLGGGAYAFRLAVAVAFVALMMVSLGAIGLFLGSVVESPTGAAGAVVGLVIVMGILGSLSPLRGIHPVLVTHWFTAWSGLLSAPVEWGPIGKGVLCAAIYVALASAAGLAIFRRRDVVS